MILKHRKSLMIRISIPNYPKNTDINPSLYAGKYIKGKSTEGHQGCACASYGHHV
jgi:hypothetical protein